MIFKPRFLPHKTESGGVVVSSSVLMSVDQDSTP